MSNFISDMPRANFRGSITTHASSLDVFPSEEFVDEPLAVIANVICGGDSPVVTSDKTTVPYFVATIYRDDVPFTEKTLPKALARGLGTHGKQRSRAHCTESAVFVYEFDGITDAQRALVEKQVGSSGLQAYIFSSYSHGSPAPDKQGNRFRVALLADVAQGHDDHEAAHEALGKELFDGVPYDPSCKRPYQQQGCWATNPEWKHHTFKLMFKGGLVDGKKAAAAGYAMRPPKVSHSSSRDQLSADEQTQRLVDGLCWIDPNTTSIWILVVTALKTLGAVIGFDNARELAVRYSERGSEDAKKHNDDPRYDPATFFDNVQPTMPPEAAMGTLCGLARDGAVAALTSGFRAGCVDHDAAQYLLKFHRREFHKVCAEYGLEVA